MRVILFILKLVESLLAFACIVIHIVGFKNQLEPLPHLMLMCGTFFGFFIVTTVSCLLLCMGITSPLLVDALLNSFAAVCFCSAAIVSMVEAERDYHLMYLTDRQEGQHLYFKMCRIQSIAALITGLWYIMHTVLIVDLLCITKRHPTESDPALSPLKLECCCLNDWCSRLAERNKCIGNCTMRRRTDRDMDLVV